MHFDDKKLGKLFFSFEKGTKEWLIGILYIFLTLLLIALAVAVIFSWVDPTLLNLNMSSSTARTWRLILTPIILWEVGETVWILWLFNPIRFSSAEIFENGVRITQGDYTYTIEFSQIEGILALSIFKIILTDGPIEFLQSPLVASAGKKKIRSVTIVEKNSQEPLIVRVPNYIEFAKVLTCFFTTYTVKTLTHNNIKKAEISFGEYLRLSEGKFVYEPPNGNRIHLPLTEVTCLEFVPTEGWNLLVIRSSNPENQIFIPAKQVRNILNVDILYYIIKHRFGMDNNSVSLSKEIFPLMH